MSDGRRSSHTSARADGPGLRMRLDAHVHGRNGGITSQHERLDDFCREVSVILRDRGAKHAIDSFKLFRAALSAHLEVEENVYFPGLRRLCPEAERRLVELVNEHAGLREQVGDVLRFMEGSGSRSALIALDQLARDISHHERAEESLIAQIMRDSPDEQSIDSAE